VLTIDPASGQGTYRPHLDYFGSDQFEFRVQDGLAVSQPATIDLSVQPLTPGVDYQNGGLTVIGSTGPDSVVLTWTGRRYTVQSNVGTLRLARNAPLSQVLVRGRGGDDVIDLSVLKSNQPAVVHGGPGSDSIRGGAGSDVLTGDDGDDTIAGGNGSDLLVGGMGADDLDGSSLGDFLLGNALNDPAGLLDLNGVLASWRGARSTTARLAAAQPLVDLALADGAADELTGAAGTDLFRAGLEDQLRDARSRDLSILL
jgi:Ca2+-binding RTX toxin-like protein